MTPDTHIYIQESTLNLTFIERIDSDVLKSNELKLVQKQKAMGPSASLEWIVPSAIGVYLLKPYFESFLKEMGKDHYGVLKNWINSNRKNHGLFKTKSIASTVSNAKIDKEFEVNNFFCVYFQLPNGAFAKIFMPQSEEEEVNENAILELLNDLAKIYEKGDSMYSAMINEFNPKSYDEIFFIFDTETKKWNVESLDSMIKKKQNSIKN